MTTPNAVLLLIILTGCAAFESNHVSPIPEIGAIDDKYRNIVYRNEYTDWACGKHCRDFKIKTPEQVLSDNYYSCADIAGIYYTELSKLGYDVKIAIVRRINKKPWGPNWHAVAYSEGMFIERRKRWRAPTMGRPYLVEELLHYDVTPGFELMWWVTQEGREYPDGRKTANSPAWAEYYERVEL